MRLVLGYKQWKHCGNEHNDSNKVETRGVTKAAANASETDFQKLQHIILSGVSCRVSCFTKACNLVVTHDFHKKVKSAAGQVRETDVRVARESLSVS